MKMSRRSLEYLAEARGFAGDFLKCISFSYDDDFVEVETTHPAYPRAKPGLGDIVAAGLSAIGVTKDRVSKAVGGDCGCAKRQEQLNELGRRVGIG
jgi:hypothetical protein